MLFHLLLGWLDGRSTSRSGILNLVDLAGSERLKKSASEGQRKTEAVHINSSLTALGKVWMDGVGYNRLRTYRCSDHVANYKLHFMSPIRRQPVCRISSILYGKYMFRLLAAP